MDFLFTVFSCDFLQKFIKVEDRVIMMELNARKPRYLASYPLLALLFAVLSMIPVGFYFFLRYTHHFTTLKIFLVLIASVPAVFVCYYTCSVLYTQIMFLWHIFLANDAWTTMDEFTKQQIALLENWELAHIGTIINKGHLYNREVRMILFRRLSTQIIKFSAFIDQYPTKKEHYRVSEEPKLRDLIGPAAVVPDRFLSITHLKELYEHMETLRSEFLLCYHNYFTSVLVLLSNSNERGPSIFSRAVEFCTDVRNSLPNSHILTGGSFALKMEILLERVECHMCNESRRMLDTKPANVEEARQQYEYLIRRMEDLLEQNYENPQARVISQILENEEAQRDIVYASLFALAVEAKRIMDRLEDEEAQNGNDNQQDLLDDDMLDDRQQQRLQSILTSHPTRLHSHHLAITIEPSTA